MYVCRGVLRDKTEESTQGREWEVWWLGTLVQQRPRQSRKTRGRSHPISSYGGSFISPHLISKHLLLCKRRRKRTGARSTPTRSRSITSTDWLFPEKAAILKNLSVNWAPEFGPYICSATPSNRPHHMHLFTSLFFCLTQVLRQEVVVSLQLFSQFFLILLCFPDPVLTLTFPGIACLLNWGKKTGSG